MSSVHSVSRFDCLVSETTETRICQTLSILLLNLFQADAAKAKVERDMAAKAQVLSDPLLRGLHQRAKKMLEDQTDSS